MIDQCTRWVEAIPLKTLTAKETCDALLRIFNGIGIPRVVCSDNGTNFVAGFTKELYSRLGIELRRSSPLHPQENSLVERFNQNLKHMLHHVVNSNSPRSWDLKLPYLLWAYRQMPNATTGLSPYELVYGKPGRGPLSILRDTWSNDTGNDPLNLCTEYEYYDKLRQDLVDANEIASKNSDQAQRKYTHQYNLRSKDKEFEVRESVLILLPDSTNKLKSCWQGQATEQVRGSRPAHRHGCRVHLVSGGLCCSRCSFLNDWLQT